MVNPTDYNSTCPVDSDLSTGLHSPTFAQLKPGQEWFSVNINRKRANEMDNASRRADNLFAFTNIYLLDKND